MVARLLLGTANFGLPYGFASGGKQVGRVELREIVERAVSLGYSGLDTAAAYGSAEEIIGKLPLPSSVVVDTKIHEGHGASGAEIANRIQISKQKLGRSPRVVYFHSPELAWSVPSSELNVALEILSADETIPTLGVSVNDFSEIEPLLEKRPQLKAFQFPSNLLSRRLIDREKLNMMKAAGVQFAVRSLLAQGILLMSEARLSSSPLLKSEIDSILELRRACELESMGVVEASVLYFVQELGVDAVVGAHRARELIDLRSLGDLEPDFETLPSLTINSLDMRQSRFRAAHKANQKP